MVPPLTLQLGTAATPSASAPFLRPLSAPEDHLTVLGRCELSAAVQGSALLLREIDAELRATTASLHAAHSFIRRLDAGELEPFQVRGWVANGFYYQVCVAACLSAGQSCRAGRSVRHVWTEHLPVPIDLGEPDDSTQIRAWLHLGNAIGLSSAHMWSYRYVTPGVRFAAQACLNAVLEACWQEAAISALADLCAPGVHSDSLHRWPVLYPWIEQDGLELFCCQVSAATCKAAEALQIAQRWCSTHDRQQRAQRILRVKLDAMWSMVDAIERAFPDDLDPKFRP